MQMFPTVTLLVVLMLGNAPTGQGGTKNAPTGKGVKTNASVGQGVKTNASIGQGVATNASTGQGVRTNASTGQGVRTNASIGQGVRTNASIGQGVTTSLNPETTTNPARKQNITSGVKIQMQTADPNNVNGQGIPHSKSTCKLNCTFLKQYLKNSFFKSENGTELKHYVHVCVANGTLSRDDRHAECTLDMVDIVGNIPETTLAELTLIIACTFPARVRIVNKVGIKRPNVISYYDVRQCVVDWGDAINFGHIVDLRVMNVLWPVSFSPVQEISKKFLIPANHSNPALLGPKKSRTRRSVTASTPTQMIEGLHNMGSLTILSPRPCVRPDNSLLCSLQLFERRQVNHSLPVIFKKFLWPRMAEVTFSDLDLKEAEIFQMQATMPYLQALEIIRNRKYFNKLPPFPWIKWHMRLPRGISRSRAGNSHYANRMDIQPNVYRRLFHLDRSPVSLSGLHLQGRLDKVVLIKSLRTNETSPQLSDVLFKDTSHLQHVDLSENNIKSLSPGFLMGNVYTIKELDLDYNNLTEVPFYLLKNMVVLQKVSMAHNRISSVSSQAFTSNVDLMEAIFSHNMIPAIREGTFSHSSNLQSLLLDHNNIRHIETNALPSRNSNSLKVLDLSYNELDDINPEVIMFRFASKIDLSHNLVSTKGINALFIGLDSNTVVYVMNHSSSSSHIELQPFNGQRKYLNLKDNVIEHIHVQHKNDTQVRNILTLLIFFDIDLTGNPLKCDCYMYAMHKFLSDRRAQRNLRNRLWLNYLQEKWLCAQPASLAGLPIEDVVGDRFLCSSEIAGCPRECSCLKRMTDDVTVVDCKDRNLTKIPSSMPAGLLELDFSRNQIKEIEPLQYLKNTVRLFVTRNDLVTVSGEVVRLLSQNGRIVDLEHNKIVRMSENVVKMWKYMTAVNILDNDFICDCETFWMQKWVRQANYLVGVKELYCVSGKPQGQEIMYAEEDDFVCQTVDQVPKIISIIFGTIFILLLLAAVLVVRYRQELKIWLYAKYDWHPFDKVDDSDPSLIFDAYVCYSSRDYKWVIHDMRNKLEREIAPEYKLMMHQRDFIPGDTIMNNIYDGIRRSKRMIMVISENFLESEWCMVEFRSAHHEVLSKNTRNYIIAILEEDFDIDSAIDSVPEDLKVFLKNTTYLKKNEANFWDKLYYALPQKGTRQLVPPKLRRRDSLVPVTPHQWPKVSDDSVWDAEPSNHNSIRSKGGLGTQISVDGSKSTKNVHGERDSGGPVRNGVLSVEGTIQHSLDDVRIGVGGCLTESEDPTNAIDDSRNIDYASQKIIDTVVTKLNGLTNPVCDSDVFVEIPLEDVSIS